MLAGVEEGAFDLAAVSVYLPDDAIALVKELPSRVPALFTGAATA